MILNSWKEISSYVGRGVRTVQRWEQELGMPIRRPRKKPRSAVIAMSEEIDLWLRSAPKNPEMPGKMIIGTHQIESGASFQSRPVSNGQPGRGGSSGFTEMREHRLRAQDLRNSSCQLRSELNSTIRVLIEELTSLRRLAS